MESGILLSTMSLLHSIMLYYIQFTSITEYSCIKND